ncbi:MAG: alkane 1-monooxygenase [Bacteroidota bacterium]|nr:alkane 1-monooxygenase [Bacteroidota bacterium]
MKNSDLRYLLAYITPLTTFLGLYFGGWASPGVLYFGFAFVPLVELFMPASVYNQDENSYTSQSSKVFFDRLLYFNVITVYIITGYFVWLLSTRSWTTSELIFSIINVGVFLGVSGINVAHELGHRQRNFDRWIARLLLLPALYSHFTLEHNFGHHLKVGTPEDPATARKNQPIYFFFIRSIVLGYRNAWDIEKRLLQIKNQPAWKSEILWSHVVQFIFLAMVYNVAGWQGMIAYLCTALVGILSLESVNYIEHYGLVRKKLLSGRYEPMSEVHSWNSNHELGRIVLYELVRHADHHYQTTRKYQTLRHMDDSPQLPFGYPMSILIAFIPPVWFWLMNPRVEAANESRSITDSHSFTDPMVAH